MPARVKSATSATPRPGRTSKEKARMTIKTTTDPKFKSLHPLETVRESPVRTPSPISGRVDPPAESGEPLSEDESPCEGLPQSNQQPQASQRHYRTDDLMDGIERMVRDTVSEAFATRDGKGKGLASSAAARVPRRYVDEGTDPPSLPVFGSSAAPRNILSRWPWVDKDTIELIANGNFQIDGLPKLHRTDELRNAYLKKALKGVYQPLEGGPAEVIIGTTKLHSSFKEPTTFFLAWHIYMSIRTTFEPSRAAGLVNWTERLFYLVHLNYPWASILEYIIAYFQLYQDTSPNDWFDPDSTLIAYHLTLSQQKAPTAAAPPTHNNGSKPKSNTNRKSESIGDEICLMHNCSAGCGWKEKKGEKCPRRHVCMVCTSSQHSALTCPGKSTK
jgi:hypothetical protein